MSPTPHFDSDTKPSSQTEMNANSQLTTETCSSDCGPDGQDSGTPNVLNTNNTSMDSTRRDSINSNASSTTMAIRNGTEVNGRRASKVVQDPNEPPDGGWGWMVVLGCILTGALVPSLFMCFGVFMNAFMEVFPNTSKSSAAWIPSIMSALMNCMGPITSALVNMYSSRVVTIAGGITLSSGLVLSYFTNSLEALYFTYGVLGGIGAGLSIAPGLYLISQYFKKRRGLATGLCMAGSSAGQIMIPYLVQYLLDEYEYRSCILILGGIILNICVAAALYRPLESSAPKVPKKPKRPRTTSQCSNRSLTFLADESGIGTIKNGSLTSKYIRNGGSNSKKNNNPKKKKSPNKNVKKGSSSVSKNEVKAILLENFLINNKQTDNLASPPRSRSRTISIDSSRILPDIPEVPEEHEDSHVTEMEKLEEEYNQCEKGEDPTYGNLSDETDLSSKNRMNENESDDHEKETLLNDAGCPSVSVSIKDNDCVKEPFLCKTEKATGNQSQELVSLHSCYGSVASIASLGPPGKDKYDNLSVLKTISKFFGLSCLKESIFYVLSLSFTCLIIVLSNYTMFVPTYGRTTLNLSKDDSAGLISIIAIASMLGRLLLPSMSDYVKIQKKHIYAVSCLVTTGAVAMTAFTTTYEFLLASLVIFGFTSGGSAAISLGVFLDYIPLEKFAAFFGLAQLCVGLFLLFSTPILGLLVDVTETFTATFWTLAAISFVSGTIIYFDRFTNYQETSPKEKKVSV